MYERKRRKIKSKYLEAEYCAFISYFFGAVIFCRGVFFLASASSLSEMSGSEPLADKLLTVFFCDCELVLTNERSELESLSQSIEIFSTEDDDSCDTTASGGVMDVVGKTVGVMSVCVLVDCTCVCFRIKMVIPFFLPQCN